MQQVDKALMAYALKHHAQLPKRLEEVSKYFPEEWLPVDAWGDPLLYVRSCETLGACDESYVLISLGADSRIGGDDEDADIWSNAVDE